MDVELLAELVLARLDELPVLAGVMLVPPEEPPLLDEVPLVPSDELPGATVTAPFEVDSEENACGLGAWMLAIACLMFTPERGARNPIPSGWGITIPIRAASRVIRWSSWSEATLALSCSL